MKIRVCDYCKDKNKEAAELCIYDGTFFSDPIEGMRKNVTISDICLQCAVKKLNVLSEALPTK